MAEVVSLRGPAAPPPGEPFAPVVSKLEELLERARRGEIVGLAYATAQVNGEGGHGWESAWGARLTLGAAVSTVAWRYAQDMATNG